MAAAGSTRDVRTLAPGDPASPINPIDARDVAQFTLRAIDQGLTGAYTVAGTPSNVSTYGELLEACVEGPPDRRPAWSGSTASSSRGGTASASGPNCRSGSRRATCPGTPTPPAPRPPACAAARCARRSATPGPGWPPTAVRCAAPTGRDVRTASARRRIVRASQPGTRGLVRKCSKIARRLGRYRPRERVDVFGWESRCGTSTAAVPLPDSGWTVAGSWPDRGGSVSPRSAAATTAS